MQRSSSNVHQHNHTMDNTCALHQMAGLLLQAILSQGRSCHVQAPCLVVNTMCPLCLPTFMCLCMASLCGVVWVVFLYQCFRTMLPAASKPTWSTTWKCFEDCITVCMCKAALPGESQGQNMLLCNNMLFSFTHTTMFVARAQSACHHMVLHT